MKRRLVLLAPLALALIPRRALAHSYTLGPIEIGHPWAKPTVTEAAALFMALYNTGDKPDRLVGASTPIATQVIFRDTGGDALEYYDLRPKRPLALRPGGRYIALHGLKKPLAIDDAFPLTLIFSACRPHHRFGAGRGRAGREFLKQRSRVIRQRQRGGEPRRFDAVEIDQAGHAVIPPAPA